MKRTFHNFFERVKLNKKSQFHLKRKTVFPTITLNTVSYVRLNYNKLFRWQVFFLKLNILIADPCKLIQDGLGFGISRCGFRIPSTVFRIRSQWNLDSGFESLTGFGIPSAELRIPKPRIADSTSKNFPD